MESCILSLIIQKTVQIKTDWRLLSIIALFCINIALFMQKNFVPKIANSAIMAIAIIAILGFISMTFGAVCGKAKNLYVANCIGSHWLVTLAAMLIYYCAVVRKCVRIRIGLELILGLPIIAAGTLASYHVDVL